MGNYDSHTPLFLMLHSMLDALDDVAATILLLFSMLGIFG